LLKSTILWGYYRASKSCESFVYSARMPHWWLLNPIYCLLAYDTPAAASDCCRERVDAIKKRHRRRRSKIPPICRGLVTERVDLIVRGGERHTFQLSSPAACRYRNDRDRATAICGAAGVRPAATDSHPLDDFDGRWRRQQMQARNSSAIAERPRDAPCQLKPCKMSHVCSSNRTR